MWQRSRSPGCRHFQCSHVCVCVRSPTSCHVPRPQLLARSVCRTGSRIGGGQAMGRSCPDYEGDRRAISAPRMIRHTMPSKRETTCQLWELAGARTGNASAAGDSSRRCSKASGVQLIGRQDVMSQEPHQEGGLQTVVSSVQVGGRNQWLPVHECRGVGRGTGAACSSNRS